MRKSNRIASAKRVTPLTLLVSPLQSPLKRLKKRFSVVGMSKMPCATSDKVPAVMRSAVLNEDRNIPDKRIAQKRLFGDDYLQGVAKSDGLV